MIESLSASQLLKISEPESLFCRGVAPSEAEIKREYRLLAKLWHSDRNHAPDAPLVFSRIAQLHDEALAKFADGKWSSPGLLNLEIGSHRFDMQYRTKRRFELGEMFIGDAQVAFLVDENYADIFRVARKVTAAFRYHRSA